MKDSDKIRIERDLIILESGKYREFFHCIVGTHCEPVGVHIDCVSMRQAKLKGWHFTDHIQFCPPERDTAAICPNCFDALPHARKEIVLKN